jgi:hypothetical protein
MSRTFLGLALASLIMMSGNAFADSFTFLSPGDVTWNGVYVNPYQAQDNTQTTVNPLTIFCDDWNTDFSGNPTWNANVYTLTLGNTSNLKYGNTTPEYNITLNNNTLGYTSVPVVLPTGSFNRYLEVAYLDGELQTALANGSLSANQKTLAQQEISTAEWTLFVDSSHVAGLIGAINNPTISPGNFALDVYNYLQGAQTAVVTNKTFTGAGWDVIVPVGNNSNGGPMQEFLVHGFSGDTVPEPSAVILLGSIVGILALTKFRRKLQT